MLVSQEKMLDYLQEAEKIKLNRLFFGSAAPPPSIPLYYYHPTPRIIFPLSGTKHIRFASNGTRHDEIFTPGNAIITHPGGWTDELWDREHRMISIVFLKDFIRVLYISHNGLPPPQVGPDVFFHTREPIGPTGEAMIRALLTANRDSESSRLCFRALLTLVREIVEREVKPLLPSRSEEWGRVQEILDLNFCSTAYRFIKNSPPYIQYMKSCIQFILFYYPAVPAAEPSEPGLPDTPAEPDRSDTDYPDIPAEPAVV